MHKRNYILASLVLAPLLVLAQGDLQLTTPLQKGMTGEDVSTLQEILARDPTIYPEGLVTGKFGAATERAVKAFQIKNHINPTGKVGKLTLGALSSATSASTPNDTKASSNSIKAPRVKTPFILPTTHPPVDTTPLIQPTSTIPAPSVASSSIATSTKHYIIRYRNKPGKNEENTISTKHGGKVRRNFQSVDAISADLNEKEITRVTSDPSILSVEEDTVVTAKDLEFETTWGVTRLGASTTYASDVIGTGVRVAILDTGIDYTHPDLIASYAGGYNFVAGNTDPKDDNGHGTHIAGTISAAHNGVGVVGVAPGVQLYALKVLDSTGSGFTSSIIAALDWAIANKIQITNNSFGSPTTMGSAAQAAYERAKLAGILNVAAAGNSGTCNTTTDTVEYPAKYTSTLAVAATDSTNGHACFSGSGTKVEISAPGVAIISTKNGGGTASFTGTSMATPHVAASAALVAQSLAAVGRPVNATTITQVLESTAQDLGTAGRDNLFGFGLVKVDAAIASILPPSTTTSPIPDVTPTPLPTVPTTTPALPKPPVATTTPAVPTPPTTPTQPLPTPPAAPSTPSLPPQKPTSTPVIPTPQPAVLSFFANPASVLPNTAFTLNWQTTNASQVRINGQVVTGTRIAVAISATTTFTLTASNASGAASQSLTVPVISRNNLSNPVTTPTKPNTNPGRRNRAGVRDISTTTESSPLPQESNTPTTHGETEQHKEPHNTAETERLRRQEPPTQQPTVNPTPTLTPVNAQGLHSNKQDGGLSGGTGGNKGGRTR